MWHFRSAGSHVRAHSACPPIEALGEASLWRQGRFPMTIRLRLTLWYTALLGATLILFSFIFYSALAANLWAQVQVDVARRAGEVARALERQLQGDILIVRVNPTRVQFPDLDLFANSVGVQIIDRTGLIIWRSDNLGKMDVLNYTKALDTIRAGSNHRFYTASDTNTPLLVYSVPIIFKRSRTDGDIVAAVQVIKPVAEVQNTLSQVTRYLIFGTALSLGLAAIVGAFLARRALAPIDAITNTARAITRTKDLSRRLHIADDTSEIGQLGATFNDMLDRIQQLFHTQERLIADVSHELRTPLTTIQANIELLRRTLTATSADPARTRMALELWQDVLGEVENETTRMGNMISDLLLLAQADSGALQLQMAPVEMDTLLLDVYRQTRRMAERAKGAQGLDVRLGSEDQALVYGDRERLRQLLLNLTDNAVKYTPDGGVITLSLENADGWVKISVADTGIGIAPEDQAHIFDRFYRADKARSREFGGSGLGLSIVQWIAQAHHGQITVTSELQSGSTFTLWLPALTIPSAGIATVPSKSVTATIKGAETIRLDGE
jgi:heavy metal sensor kinase